MRSITTIILGGLLAIAPLSARANVESCTASLLRSNDMFQELQLSAWQSQQLQAIRAQTESQQSSILSQLEQVRPALDQARQENDETGRVQQLEAQEAALVQRFNNVATAAAGRINGLLNEWQRSRCAGETESVPMVEPMVEPQPEPPLVAWRVGPARPVRVWPAPPPVVHRVPPRIVRHAPPRYLPRPAPRIVHRAPPRVVRHEPPRVVHREPPRVVHREPPRPMPPVVKHQAPPREPGPSKGWHGGQGPKGPQGPQGPQGHQGPKGYKGHK